MPRQAKQEVCLLSAEGVLSIKNVHIWVNKVLLAQEYKSPVWVKKFCEGQGGGGGMGEA